MQKGNDVMSLEDLEKASTIELTKLNIKDVLSQDNDYILSVYTFFKKKVGKLQKQFDSDGSILRILKKIKLALRSHLNGISPFPT